MVQKRIFDITLVMLVMPLILPLYGFVALLVARYLGRPVLFRQERPGFQGKPFTLIKFRSMADHRDANGDYLPDAQRLTPFGGLLRQFSLDELPELWNVLKGDMSLVGPRPLLMEYLDHYTPEQARRHDVLPGVTGWAQIHGRNAQSWEDRFALDIWYVDNRSIWLDIRILFTTIWKVLTREGISAEGHATMPFFKGSEPVKREELRR